MKNRKKKPVERKQFNTFGEALSMLDKFMGYDPAAMRQIVDQGERGRAVYYLFGQLGTAWGVKRLGPPGEKAWKVHFGAMFTNGSDDFAEVNLLPAHFAAFATSRTAVEKRVDRKWKDFLGEEGCAMFARADEDKESAEDMDHLSHLFLECANTLEGEERQIFVGPLCQGIERIKKAEALIAETRDGKAESKER